MKKDVWLTISSQQQFAGCDEENIDLQTAATLYERGGKYYIAYEESELTGLEGTKTTVKLDGKTVAELPVYAGVNIDKTAFWSVFVRFLRTF